MNRAKAKRHRNTGDQPEPTLDAPKRSTLLSGRLILLCVMILLVAGGIIGLSVSVPKKRPVATTQPVFSPAPTDLTPGIPNPSPWQYDPVTDRHWVATVGHNHWHQGRPPQNPGTATTTAGPTFTPSFGPTTRLSSGVPAIADPQPWEYDPVTHKYWDPREGHLHWHGGEPPPPDQRQSTPPKTIVPPAPDNP